jgi:SAM-dependent methyltransferase
MREDKKKKSMPLANPAEAAVEAPGLRVGSRAWKWPPIWPYDQSFFVPTAQALAVESQAKLKRMASMFTGIAQVPATLEAEKDLMEEESKFDALKFWDGEAPALTELDPEAAEKLREHYAFYLKDGMSILELGAAENSYLPIKPSRHVGVGCSQKLMEQNPSLTETMVVDLNKVIKDRDVESDDLRRLAQEPFDAVVMANTVEFLTSPREVFRSAWYLLKPGGIMIVSFSGKEATKNKFTDAQTKIWRDYSDDQHIWITGSFFQFSAGDGWESLLGFDISPDSAKQRDSGEGLLAGFFNRGKANNYFAVQAIKGFQDDRIDPENTERSIKSLCWMLPTMEERDKLMVVPRIARAYETAESDAVKEAIERNLHYLPVIYESLIKMDQFSFTFSMQSQMAADLISDPDFVASEEQILALKQGLGLRTPSKEFWAPVGENTSSIPIEDKISLLAAIVPCFGSGNPAQEEALQAFLSGMKPTYAVIRSKCPGLPESDVQLLGTELLAAEVLKPGRSTREEFAAWLAAFTESELLDLVAERKSIRIEAKEELIAYKEARAEEQKQKEEYTRRMNEQIQQAREGRSMIFNPKTQKMELFNRK